MACTALRFFLLYFFVITNDSDKELELQDDVKVMQWSTGKEIEGDSGKIHNIICFPPASLVYPVQPQSLPVSAHSNTSL